MGKNAKAKQARATARQENRAKAAGAPTRRRWLLPAAALLAVAGLALALILTIPGRQPNAADGAAVSLDSGHELHHVRLELADRGTIDLELDATVAPLSVANFLSLAEAGFYDGLTFHRVVEGFMIQGGDGHGAAAATVAGEFAANGWENELSHVRGAVSMARSQDNNSATSQFFICQADSTFLDGNYACFGYVVAGLSLVDQICADAADWPRDENGVIQDASQQPVISSVTVLD